MQFFVFQLPSSPYSTGFTCQSEKKTSHQMFGHMHEVLNEVHLQNFLHGWTVNREMNLMSLLNS